MKSGGLWNDFQWHVETAGYRWEELPTGPLLVPVRSKSARVQTRAYRPLTRPFSDLFARLAELDPTEKEVLAFANEFGQLGWPITTVTFGSEISLIPAASAFDAVSFVRRGDLRLSYLGPVGEYLTAPSGASDQVSWTAQIEKLRNFQQNRRHLRKFPQVAGSLQMEVNLQLASTVGAFLSMPLDRKTFDLRIWPKSLVGALWLQAAQAVSEKAEFRKCKECGGPIEISRSGARSDATFCSDACKLRDYRQRQTKARQLHERGSDLKTIATKLKTKTETVRRWLR